MFLRADAAHDTPISSAGLATVHGWAGFSLHEGERTPDDRVALGSVPCWLLGLGSSEPGVNSRAKDPVIAGLYGGAYLIAWLGGWVSFQQVWPSHKIAINLAVNIPLLVVLMGFGSVGEELGWRGYLQPRLDQAGVRYAVVWVGLLWFLFHLPIMLIGGYQQGGSFGVVLLFAVACVADAVVWTWACYRYESLWPAIWFHTFHNMASQWLFPKFFLLARGDLLLGEDGVLPTLLHVLAAVLVILLARPPMIQSQP